jgi:hypothetical protein
MLFKNNNYLNMENKDLYFKLIKYKIIYHNSLMSFYQVNMTLLNYFILKIHRKNNHFLFIIFLHYQNNS